MFAMSRVTSIGPDRSRATNEKSGKIAINAMSHDASLAGKTGPDLHPRNSQITKTETQLSNGIVIVWSTPDPRRATNSCSSDFS